MFELQKFQLGRDEETLRRAREIRLGNLGSLVEIDGAVLDELLVLADETVRQEAHELFEGMIEAE